MSDPTQRGLLIVIEGCDRSGKSTQLKLLENCFKTAFPNRSTIIGGIINNYLQSTTTDSSRNALSDQAIHLLFSANRWEGLSLILEKLDAGIDVVCDRYAYSGCAFSVAKGLPLEWCMAPDVGLPIPDLVLYLDILPSLAATRGEYGLERYERPDFQAKVRDCYLSLFEPASWKILDASVDVQELHVCISECIAHIKSKPVSPLQHSLWKH